MTDTQTETMSDDTRSAVVRRIVETSLHGEPPLSDMVTGAVAGAARRKRRDRLTMAGASLAVLALGAGAYEVRPDLAGSGRHVSVTAGTHTRPVFPPVAGSQPLNPTPAAHAAALSDCSQDWSAALSQPASNTLPTTQAEAVDMCTMTGELLMTLLPNAQVTLPKYPDGSMVGAVGRQWEIQTAQGKAILGISYLWPDALYEKQHYGPFDECGPNPVAAPTTTYVTGPDGKPFAMRNPNAGHDMECVQTRPAPQFWGALTLDQTTGGLWYSVVDHDYGRYLIGTGTPQIEVPKRPTTGSYEELDGKYIVPDPNAGNPLTRADWSNLLTDPRFNDFLVRYENYVLTHADAASFTVSGSNPLH